MIVGEIRIFAGAIPSGWLPLGSAPVSRTTYAALFAYLGTTFGVGDGLTTFGIPPAERVPIPAGAQAGLTTRALGDVGGEEAVTLTAAESGVPDSVVINVTDPGHTHGNGSYSVANHFHSLSGTAVCSINDPGHFHVPPSANFVTNDAGTEYETTLGDHGNPATQTDTKATGITAAMSGGTDGTATSVDGGNSGSSAAGVTAQTIATDASDSHSNMSPFCAYNFAIYAGA